MAENATTTDDEVLIDHALTVLRLKDVVRTGWVLRGIRQPESVADHSWGTAFLTLLFAPEDGTFDRDRALEIAILHDVAEVETGDIPRRVAPGDDIPTPEEKAAREGAAIERLMKGSKLANIGRLRRRWSEYEAGADEESRFVRDMNLLDMCMQAVVYEGDRRYDPDEASGNAEFPDFRHLDEFFATSGPRFATRTGKKLFHRVKMRYERVLDSW